MSTTGIQQLLQAFAAVFAITGLDHGVVGALVGQYPVHHRNGCQVAFEIAFHRFGAEPGVRPTISVPGAATVRACSAMASVMAAVVLTLAIRIRMGSLP